MTTAEFVPYSQRAPDTTDLRELRQELAHVRQVHGRRSSEALEAYGRLNREASRQGQPLDGLRKYATNEVERFFAQTIPGPDGHVYWDGAKRFRCNDGKTRTPRRWWWAHRHGSEPDLYDDVVATCGDLQCINPEHCQTGRDLRRRQYSTEHMVGLIQVAAMRLGRPPSTRDWDDLAIVPTRKLYTIRFGSWDNALRAAGQDPRKAHGRIRRASPARCVAAIRCVRQAIGHWPTQDEFVAARAHTRAADLPTTATSIHRHLGLWADALRKAGKRDRP